MLPSSLSRRKFIHQIAGLGTATYLGMTPLLHFRQIAPDSKGLPLYNWEDWKNFTKKVEHPCLTIKKQDLAYARENINRYSWAKDYATTVENEARRYHHLINPTFLVTMIEENTPGDPLFTPCPSCRDQGKPVHPHGLWEWNVTNPDELKCTVCRAIFPNTRYPESITFKTKWGKPQTISYYGGETFTIFGYKEGRPSFTANIRSRKVQWMADYCHTLAEAYVLSGNTAYAISCKQILLRFADCYPNWLVHVGYGEYADMDPKVAAEHIAHLPFPEICPPPNQPDNSLWTGYWSAGRAAGAGLESDFVRKVVSAYDLTCAATKPEGEPLYSPDEKYRIEKDLLLESTPLMISDTVINNKSVSNHSAVALVGMCIGHPGLVRFGLNSFNQTVDGWYLPDGTSSESPFYGLMTLGGIWDTAQAARGYNDPEGYKDEKGDRLETLNLYKDTNYNKVLDAFFKGLQGNLKYAPYADSFRDTTLAVSYVELMVANFPERKEYFSLLKELCGEDLAIHSGSVNSNLSKEEKDDRSLLILPYDLSKPAGYASFSLYYRKPGLEQNSSSPLALPDWMPPELRIAHLRTGETGRESLLLMNGSHWGNHHELDSLHIYYWKKDREILSDLGYLWDHPQKIQTQRTVAHNTVVINQKNQRRKERGGDILFFKTTEHVKAVEMSSRAYEEAKIYRRTSAIIDHGNGNNYVVDFFRVEGGEIQDYVFHLSSSDHATEGITLTPAAIPLYDFKNIRSGKPASSWLTKWKSGSNMNCRAWAMSDSDEEVFVGDGWGQRDWKNTDIGATLPYIIRRKTGSGLKAFVSVFEASEENNSFIKSLRWTDGAMTLCVETKSGRDYIMSAFDTGTLKADSDTLKHPLSGHFALVSIQNGKLAWQFLVS